MVGFSSLRDGTETTNMKQIPIDVVFAILSRLPLKSLGRFKCVCKDWRALIQDPAFVDFHLEQGKKGSAKTLFTVCMSSLDQTKLFSLSYFIKIDCSTATPSQIFHKLDDDDDHDVEMPRCDSIIASCNGLFLGDRVYNPATRETLDLPMWNSLIPKNGMAMMGIGFDSIRKEYKVVCWDTQNDKMVHIITLGADSWRTIVSPSIGRANYSSSHSTVYLNGASHWYTAAGILSFDFTEEKFSCIPLPADMLPAHDHRCQISELEGQLCLVVKGVNISSLKLWTLTDSWTPEWVNTQIHLPEIENGEFLRVVPIRKGEILVDINLVSCGRVCVCRYNEDGQVTDFIHVTGIPYFLGVPYQQRYHALYVESLLSFKQYKSKSEANQHAMLVHQRSEVPPKTEKVPFWPRCRCLKF